jgi:hypothetical protein
MPIQGTTACRHEFSFQHLNTKERHIPHLKGAYPVPGLPYFLTGVNHSQADRVRNTVRAESRSLKPPAKTSTTRTRAMWAINVLIHFSTSGSPGLWARPHFNRRCLHLPTHAAEAQCQQSLVDDFITYPTLVGWTWQLCLGIVGVIVQDQTSIVQSHSRTPWGAPPVSTPT